MELHQNGVLFCAVLDQLEGSPMPLYLPRQLRASGSVRTLFLEVAREPPPGLEGLFTFIDGHETLRIKIVDWNRVGQRIWIRCYVVNPPPPS